MAPSSDNPDSDTYHLQMSQAVPKILFDILAPDPKTDTVHQKMFTMEPNGAVSVYLPFTNLDTKERVQTSKHDCVQGSTSDKYRSVTAVNREWDYLVQKMNNAAAYLDATGTRQRCDFAPQLKQFLTFCRCNHYVPCLNSRGSKAQIEWTPIAKVENMMWQILGVCQKKSAVNSFSVPTINQTLD